MFRRDPISLPQLPNHSWTATSTINVPDQLPSSLERQSNVGLGRLWRERFGHRREILHARRSDTNA
jgi:hypothetical protein